MSEVYTLQQLMDMKKSGQKLNWNTMTKEQMEQLFYNDKASSSIIGVLYGVSANKVKYFRTKNQIKEYNCTNTKSDYFQTHYSMAKEIENNMDKFY